MSSIKDTRDLLAPTLDKLFLTRTGEMEVVTRELLGLQAQFNQNPYYSLKIRSNNYDEAIIEEDFVKTWSFRGTMHFVHKDDLSLHLSARNNFKWNDHWEMEDHEMDYWSQFIVEQIRNGYSTREALKEQCLAANMDEDHFKSFFHGWGGVLRDMCLQGLIAYKPTNKKEFIVLDPIEFIDHKEARAKVIEQYFKVYGPASLQDCRGYTGYKITEIKQLIKSFDIELYEYPLDGTIYYSSQILSLEHDVPEIVLLTGFDPLFLGYRDKSRFMDPSEQKKYVTNTGIIFPGVLVNGRLAARWQKTNKDITVKPYRKLLVKHKKQITRQLKELHGDLEINIDETIL